MDACIMVEDTEVVTRDEQGEEVEVKLLAQVDRGENVRKEGSDVKEGEKVLEKGDVVSQVGGELGTLAFVGKRSVSLRRLTETRCTVSLTSHEFPGFGASSTGCSRAVYWKRARRPSRYDSEGYFFVLGNRRLEPADTTFDSQAPSLRDARPWNLYRFDGGNESCAQEGN